MFACLHGTGNLTALAMEFSPTVEVTGPDTVTFDVSGAKGVTSMTGEVSRDASGLVMKGGLTGGGKGWTIKAVFTVSKPE